MIQHVGVFCGASEKLREEFYELAFELGSFLARHNQIVVHGGIDAGLMRSLNDGCYENGGETIGIIPEIFINEKISSEKLSKSIFVKDTHQRKAEIMSMCDYFILLPGGFGSLDEFFFMLTQFQTNHNWKKIFIVNYDNYYTTIFKLTKTMLLENFCDQSDFDNLIFIKDHHSIKPYLNQ